MSKPPANDFQRAVEAFKRELLRVSLEAHGGNRTHAARALGLQRTYLLRLVREYGVRVPHASRNVAIPD
jgi:DNA-binding NtrC family response regulator